MYISPAGKAGYYEYIFTPVIGPDGEVAAVAGSTRDITERKRREQQRDDFLAVVSHELKTPVTSLKAAGQVLQKQLEKAGQMRAVEHLVKMDGQINKLAALIGDLLDMAMVDGGRLQLRYADFPFDEVVSETIEEVQQTTGRHTIRREGETRTTINGDRDRIRQVLINLLTNAVKYSPDADSIVVTSSANGDGVTLGVQDFGMGISLEKQLYVFEPFYRVSEEHQVAIPGLGLGLYVSAEIIQRHGGRIWVVSEPGEGSTFCFTLPAQPGQKATQHVSTTSGTEDVTQQ